jgi:WD40 repeat protein
LIACTLSSLVVIAICGCTKSEEPAYNCKKRQEPSVAEKAGNSSKRAALAFSPDGNLVSVFGSSIMRLWDITSAKPVCSMKLEKDSPPLWSPDYTYPLMNSLRAGFTRDGVPYYGNHGRYLFCDKHSGDFIRELSAPDYKAKDGGMIVHPYALSQDASSQIVCTDTKTNSIFEVKAVGIGNKKYSTITTERRIGIDFTYISQDGKYFIYPVNDSELALIATDTGSEVVRFIHEPIADGDSYTSSGTYTTRSFVSLSPDSKYAALYTTTAETPTSNTNQIGGQNGIVIDSASSISSVNIFSRNKTTPLFKAVFKGLILNVVFSQDNTTFALLYNGEALIYDTKTLKVIHVLYSDHEPIMAIAFSPDNKRIATIDGKCTLKIWDAKTGKEVLSLEK